jgi:probable HAF family extracellular repeat protein
MTRTRLARSLATFSLVLASAVLNPAPRAQSSPGPYTLTDLGTLGGLSAQANDMNEAAQITGYATNSSNWTRAFRWDDGNMTDLGTLGGSAGVGVGINGLGHVVGYSNLFLEVRAWRRCGATVAVINMTPDLAAGQGSSARAINDSGQAIVQISYGDGFLWENGARTALGDLGGGFGSFRRTSTTPARSSARRTRAS